MYATCDITLGNDPTIITSRFRMDLEHAVSVDFTYMTNLESRAMRLRHCGALQVARERVWVYEEACSSGYRYSALPAAARIQICGQIDASMPAWRSAQLADEPPKDEHEKVSAAVPFRTTECVIIHVPHADGAAPPEVDWFTLRNGNEAELVQLDAIDGCAWYWVNRRLRRTRYVRVPTELLPEDPRFEEPAAELSAKDVKRAQDLCKTYARAMDMANASFRLAAQLSAESGDRHRVADVSQAHHELLITLGKLYADALGF